MMSSFAVVSVFLLAINTTNSRANTSGIIGLGTSRRYSDNTESKFKNSPTYSCPPGYALKLGYIPKGGVQVEGTPEAIAEKCNALPDCVGFGFSGASNQGRRSQRWYTGTYALPKTMGGPMYDWSTCTKATGGSSATQWSTSCGAWKVQCMLNQDDLKKERAEAAQQELHEFSAADDTDRTGWKYGGRGMCVDSTGAGYSWRWADEGGDLKSCQNYCEKLYEDCRGVEYGEWENKCMLLFDKNRGNDGSMVHTGSGLGEVKQINPNVHTKASCWAKVI